MTENIERITSHRKPAAHFWDQVRDATRQIEELNEDSEADPYGALSTVRNILDDLECAATFVNGRYINEVTFLVAALSESISAVSWVHFMARQAAE